MVNCIFCLLLCVAGIICTTGHGTGHDTNFETISHVPTGWFDFNFTRNAKGSSNIDNALFNRVLNDQLENLNRATDGEIVDALEHFFWGKKEGVAMELGALDGTPATHSMTYAFEKELQWKRILIEGDPSYRCVNFLQQI